MADSFRAALQEAFPSALVTGCEVLEPVLTNHPKDRHVLAAAIKTFNLKDFPADALQPWEVAARHPQEFLITLYSLAPEVVVAKLNEIAIERGWTPEATLARLGQAVPAFVAHVAAALEWDLPELA